MHIEHVHTTCNSLETQLPTCSLILTSLEQLFPMSEHGSKVVFWKPFLFQKMHTWSLKLCTSHWPSSDTNKSAWWAKVMATMFNWIQVHFQASFTNSTAKHVDNTVNEQKATRCEVLIFFITYSRVQKCSLVMCKFFRTVRSWTCEQNNGSFLNLLLQVWNKAEIAMRQQLQQFSCQGFVQYKTSSSDVSNPKTRKYDYQTLVRGRSRLIIINHSTSKYTFYVCKKLYNTALGFHAWITQTTS